LAQARSAALITRSGITLGLGETEAEILGALGDVRGVGVHIVTLRQHHPTSRRDLPVMRRWTPQECSRLQAAGEAMGIPHVELRTGADDVDALP
jgi:lipoic acid synthetase